jgi:hypothetical protein
MSNSFVVVQNNIKPAFESWRDIGIAEIDQNFRIISNALESVESCIKLKEFVQNTEEKNYSPLVHRQTVTSLEYFKKLNGDYSKTYGLESFSNSSKSIALEGISEFIEKAWEGIKNFFSKIWEWIKKFFGFNKQVGDRLDAVKDKTKKLILQVQTTETVLSFGEDENKETKKKDLSQTFIGLKYLFTHEDKVGDEPTFKRRNEIILNSLSNVIDGIEQLLNWSNELLKVLDNYQKDIASRRGKNVVKNSNTNKFEEGLTKLFEKDNNNKSESLLIFGNVYIEKEEIELKEIGPNEKATIPKVKKITETFDENNLVAMDKKQKEKILNALVQNQDDIKKYFNEFSNNSNEVKNTIEKTEKISDSIFSTASKESGEKIEEIKAGISAIKLVTKVSLNLTSKSVAQISKVFEELTLALEKTVKEPGTIS